MELPIVFLDLVLDLFVFVLDLPFLVLDLPILVLDLLFFVLNLLFIVLNLLVFFFNLIIVDVRDGLERFIDATLDLLGQLSVASNIFFIDRNFRGWSEL